MLIMKPNNICTIEKSKFIQKSVAYTIPFISIIVLNMTINNNSKHVEDEYSNRKTQIILQQYSSLLPRKLITDCALGIFCGNNTSVLQTFLSTCEPINGIHDFVVSTHSSIKHTKWKCMCVIHWACPSKPNPTHCMHLHALPGRAKQH